MYKFKNKSSQGFGFWDIQNKFIKKKSNKFISNVDFSKSTAKPKIDLKNIQQNKTFEKSFKSKVDFSEIDTLLKKSKQFLSFKNNLSFNDEQTLDELLDESLLLIICTKLIYSTKRYNKKLYQKIFGNDWKDIQSLL